VEASMVAFLVCAGAGVCMIIAAQRRGHILPPPWKRGR